MAKTEKGYNRKEYEKKAFKYQNVCFKMEEMMDIEAYCEKYGAAKNTLIRKAVMEFIGKSID